MSWLKFKDLILITCYWTRRHTASGLFLSVLTSTLEEKHFWHNHIMDLLLIQNFIWNCLCKVGSIMVNHFITISLCFLCTMCSGSLYTILQKIMHESKNYNTSNESGIWSFSKCRLGGITQDMYVLRAKQDSLQEGDMRLRSAGGIHSVCQQCRKVRKCPVLFVRRNPQGRQAGNYGTGG